MANAMKKLKLLHHLTAASQSAQATGAAVNQQLVTPPTSPQTSTLRHHFQANNYTDVLRSARAALHTLHTSQGPPPPPAQQQSATQKPCLLPGGFMVLTPQDSCPAICVPTSPTGVNCGTTTQTNNSSLYSSRPPPFYPQYHHHHRTTSRSRPKLSKDNVSRIGKDSRLARWERVLSYVRDQKTQVCPSSQSSGDYSPQQDSLAWSSYVFSSSGSPQSHVSRKRRAEEWDEIERKNAVMDQLDRAEMETHSLWSGGSAGTNGVDDYVWDDDDSDAGLPASAAPPPRPLFTAPPPKTSMDIDEEGVFEMEAHHADGDVAMFMGGLDELPKLCREGELAGGLGALRARRMTIY